jgi:hypothetical protein
MRAGRPRGDALFCQLKRHGLLTGVVRDLAGERVAVGRDRFDDVGDRLISLLQELLI